MESVTVTATLVVVILAESDLGGRKGEVAALSHHVRQRFRKENKEDLLNRVKETPKAVIDELIKQIKDDQEYQNHLEKSLDTLGLTRQALRNDIVTEGGIKLEDISLKNYDIQLLERVVLSRLNVNKDIKAKDISINYKRNSSIHIEILKEVIARDITLGDITIFLNNKPETIPNNLRRDGTRNFIGRERELEELESQLYQAGRLAITAIEGMGGIGKTELALQYALAARNSGKYPGGICWIDVRGQNIVDEILDFANNYLDFVPPDSQTPEKKVEICWNRWSELFKEEKLLILDDVADYTQIHGFLPPYDPNLKVIITTRLRLPSLQSLFLEVLQDKDALVLLKMFIGEDRVNRELKQAQKLCDFVANLPLGLTLIGLYLKEFPGDSLEELLEKLEEEGIDQESFQETENFIGENQTNANLWRGERRLYENLYAVFNLDWKYLEKEAKQLGAILSLFNVPPYTWSLVEKVSKPIAKSRGYATRNLKGLHIIHEDEATPLHSLIQEFFLKKLRESEDFLNIQDVLFDNFVFQQYIYDTGYLENNLKQVKKARNFLPESNVKGYVILNKMIGHSYYANRTLDMKEAIENMITAQNRAENESCLSTENEKKVWLWYQLFSLDHTHNLVATTPNACIDIFGQQVTAEELQTQLELLLPDSLKQLAYAPDAGVCPYILRAAHYWGHRGNQSSYRLFRDIVILPRQELEELYNQGIEYYARAAVFRLVNFRLSCSKEYDKHLNNWLLEAPYIPEWLQKWKPLDFQDRDINFERFTSASQAIGDTAHQYRGIAVVELWSYLYRAPIGVDQLFLTKTKQVIEITQKLWKSAKQLLKPNEKIIRYYLWMANLETIFELVENHHSGRKLMAWEEAERRLIEDLDMLEEEFRLSYPWAREKSLEQLKQFYDVLRGISPSQP